MPDGQFETAPSRLRQRESLPEGRTGLYKEGENWFASLDGVHRVPVPSYLAENIDEALGMQEQIDESMSSWAEGEHDDFFHAMRLLNCRKSAAMVAGALHIDEATLEDLPTVGEILAGSHGDEGMDPDEALDSGLQDRDGVLDLLRDVKRLVKRGDQPLITQDGASRIIARLFRQKSFPQIMHLFGFRDPRDTSAPLAIARGVITQSFQAIDILEKRLRFDHTFIILGKDETGRCICFHKRGPKLEQPFEIADLETVLSFYVFDEVVVNNNSGDPIKPYHLAISGPLPIPISAR